MTARVIASEDSDNADIAGGTLDNQSFIEINGVVLTSFNVAVDDADHELRNQINAVSDQTGVLAEYDEDNRLKLTAADGRNIEVRVSDANAAAVTGLSDQVTTGRLEFSSDEQFTITGGQVEDLGVVGDQVVGVDSLRSVSTIDVLSRANANTAIVIVDRALEQLSKDRPPMVRCLIASNRRPEISKMYQKMPVHPEVALWIRTSPKNRQPSREVRSCSRPGYPYWLRRISHPNSQRSCSDKGRDKT